MLKLSMKQHTLNPNKTVLNNHKWYSPISSRK